ncbi:MAG: repeat containing protein [Bacillales bacterium]|jgi:DNA-binding beta-propeller fold protein YncE|nr:repeat containing protein [Bacillales bacterium]
MNKKRTHQSMVAIFIIVSLFFSYMYFFKKEGLILPDMVTPLDTPPKHMYSIYGGFESEGLDNPYDMAYIDGEIYVSDTQNARIVVFDVGGSMLRSFGEAGTAFDKFGMPYGIDGDENGNIYIADLKHGAVKIFDKKGKFKSLYLTDEAFSAPTDIRIKDNKIYVADVGLGKVVAYDLKTNKLVKEYGVDKKGKSKLNAPNGVAVDDEGNVYVSNSSDSNIIKYDKNGKQLMIVNGSGSKDGKGTSIFVQPRGIGVDSRGRILVVDMINSTAYGFDSEGKKLFEFAERGSEQDQITLPRGLFVDDNNFVYIADTALNRIQVFR